MAVMVMTVTVMVAVMKITIAVMTVTGTVTTGVLRFSVNEQSGSTIDRTKMNSNSFSDLRQQ